MKKNPPPVLILSEQDKARLHATLQECDTPLLIILQGIAAGLDADILQLAGSDRRKWLEEHGMGSFWHECRLSRWGQVVAANAESELHRRGIS